MSLGDRVDDGKAEARSAGRAALVEAAEALERARHELGRQARALVADVQLDAPVDG